MPNEKSGLEQLFKNPNESQFNLPQQEQPSENEDALPEDLKNRHVRRLEEKLQRERESNIEMAARLQALSEVQKFRQETGSDEYEEEVKRIFGTEKPENAAATEILLKAFKGYSERSKREALDEIRREMREQQAEETKELQTVKSYIEEIEDQYGVDLTSSQAARERQQEFRDLWFRLSPKDADGEVKEYADPHEVWDIFQSRQPASRAQGYAARGMQRSNQVERTVDEDATLKYLHENGILPPRLN